MGLQIEAILQQRPEHLKDLCVRSGSFRLCLNVVPLLFQPIRPSDDLELFDVIRKGDQVFK
jgi:hypothetical protein